jgi:hypothetical protein
MNQQIYTIGIRLRWDQYKYKLFTKDKHMGKRKCTKNKMPIFAEDEKQAIERYTSIFNIEEYEPELWNGYYYKNLEREVISIPTLYSLDELQENMISDDFLIANRN